MPVVLGGLFSRGNPDSDSAADLTYEFADLLKTYLRPNDYGDALEHIFLSLHCPLYGEEPHESELSIGTFRTKQKALYCTLFIGVGFANWALPKRKMFFADAVRSTLNVLEKKFEKKKITYDIHGFRQDLEIAIEEWCKS